jgi:hypothetical protein
MPCMTYLLMVFITKDFVNVLEQPLQSFMPDGHLPE